MINATSRRCRSVAGFECAPHRPETARVGGSGLHLDQDELDAPVTETRMAAFDYGSVAELFPTRNEAELFPARSRKLRRDPVGYRRFARAADAIRFAVEELPPELLSDACLEVDEELFDRNGILRLYESDEYPLVRRAAIR